MKGVGDDIIMQHYSKVAQKHGHAPTSSMGDQVIRNGEIIFFIETLKSIIVADGEGQSLLDVGCGNGHLLTILRLQFPKLKLYGLEFHPDLADLASSREVPNCQIVNADMRQGVSQFGQHDVIISERSIINLLSKEEQHCAFGHIVKAIKPNGHYLLSESFEEPRTNLNRALSEMKLPADIKPSKHNLWLCEEDMAYLQELGMTEFVAPIASNYLSTHFYITRVLHSAFLPKGGGSNEFQKFFNQALPAAVGNYSPILFRSFAKSK